MTAKQKSLYWREWAAVRKVEPTADRHDLHIKALGKDKSSSQFENKDLDKVLSVFRAISQPYNLHAQVNSLQQPKIRLLYAIHLQVTILKLFVEDPRAYARAILKDKFNTSFLEDLSEEKIERIRKSDEAYLINDSDLEMMRFTLAGRIDAFRRNAGWSVHDLNIASNQECKCAICQNQRPPRSTPFANRKSKPPVGNLQAACTTNDNTPF